MPVTYLSHICHTCHTICHTKKIFLGVTNGMTGKKYDFGVTNGVTGVTNM